MNSKKKKSITSQGQMFAHEEETPKSCCGVVVTQTVSIRWFIVMISFVGICCVIVGTVLGAMKASGREHLTVSLLMIGVGIVLVTVSVVAWRLTSQDASSCRSMLGLGGGDDSSNEPNQRFVPRMPPSYGRPHHPYAAMMYPEFQYRPPPPSYQASMQEYRLRLLLLERPNDTGNGLQATMSPPPTYRSQAGSTLGLRSLPQSEYSHPPSYRSRTSSTRPTLDPNGEPLSSVNHSNPVDLHRGDTDLQIDSIKLGVNEEVPIPPLRMLLNKGKRSPTTSSDDTKSDNVNLVTIVTVSDNNNATPNRDHSVEN
ncbi:conserved hypothetical protein [Pediculus humanus corporis]|uniref:Uncharacterized protein n=1 Tax=Pediculus humanus subsp. corporis TaxID=121224 RepID=E0VKV2_PEDHC|nr:uncharacterized protein Phum_PHUM270210 [Pediculus humanus corporis]EEB14008.1 conserved hypothetical protein [Pediculus humanus corporis]